MTRLRAILATAFLVMVLAGPAPAQVPDSCENMLPGDANSDGVRNVGDFIFLVDYFTSEGPAPEPLANGDFDGNCVIDSLDAYGTLMYLFKCKSGDKCGYMPAECTCVQPEIGEFYQDLCFGTLPGDANSDGVVHVADAVFLINYIFKDGIDPGWYGPIRCDANCDCQINIGDAVYIINHVFKGGPAPCACDEIIEGCGINKAGLIIDWILTH